MADPTLVRLFHHDTRVANIDVDDWETRDGHAQFTIPADHPVAGWLLREAVNAPTVIVMSTDEIEWLIREVSTVAWRDVAWPHPDYAKSLYRVRLISRTRHLRDTQPDDDYCRKMFGVQN